MILWIIFAGLTAAAMIAVLWPLLRPGKQEMEAAAYETAVFKDQLDEITLEKERGVISKTEAEAARTEVSRRLLAAARTSDSKRASASGALAGNMPALALICTIICVPIISATLYLAYGSPALPDRPLAARLNNSASAKKIEALVAQVEARLRSHPEEGRGWEVLAPVYMKQQRYSDAADAFGKALRLLGETPQRLVEYGNALVLSNDGVVTERALLALQKAAAGDGSLVRAHFWLAVALEQDGHFTKAAEAWRDLLKRSTEDAPWREAVRQRLAAVEQRTGASVSEKSAVDTGTTPSDTIARGPNQGDIAAARGMSASDRTTMIAKMVAGLAERLKSEGGDVEEWKRLVRSYTVLGKKQEAVKALADARGAFTDDPKSLASLNELANSLGF
jgi:cytochrome c-type biogenesis protein CcmH